MGIEKEWVERKTVREALGTEEWVEKDWERSIGYREGVGGEKDCERSIGYREGVGGEKDNDGERLGREKNWERRIVSR